MDKPAKRAILALALVPALLACPSSDAWADDAPAADAPQRWASPLQTTRGTFSIGGSASVSYATIVGVDPPYPGALVRDQAHLSFAIAPLPS